MAKELEFYKNNPADIIWWVDNPDVEGVWEFTFDKEHIFNMFRDFPHALTKEQVQVFCNENPYWANFFKDRLT